MDFLRAAAKCLFYDYSLEYVADCICGSRNDKGKRHNHLLDKMSEYLLCREQNYSRESISSVTDFIVKEWMGGGTLEGESLNRLAERCFLLLRFFVNEVLSDGYVVKFEHLLHWKDLSLYIGEDLLLCVAHADATVNNGVKWKTDAETYCWSNPVKHDHAELNALLNNGLDDVHSHLNGSVDGGELAWIFLMNHPYRLDSILGDAKESAVSRDWVAVAIMIRAMLYDWLCEGRIKKDEMTRLKQAVDGRPINTDDLQDYAGKHREDNLLERAGEPGWDYAEAGGLDSELRKSSLAYHRGERRFMTWMLVAALSKSSSFKDALPLFYLYLLIKIRFRRDYVQTNPLIGLQNFNHYYHALDKYKEDWQGRLDTKGKLKYALNTSIREGHTDTVEVRLSPDSFDLIKNTKWLEGKKNVNFVLTLFKSCRDDDKAATTKYSGLQSELIRKLREILDLVKTGSLLKIVGIDVVGSDLQCRPYVIAPFLRYAAEKGIIHITYHAAEDFCDIIDGLRSLDELTSFAEYKDSYRIGHASVLGVNVEKYYQKRKRNVVCSRQTLLDNYIWLSRVDRIMNNVAIAPEMRRELESKAEEQFKVIYPGLSFSANDYWDSMQLRSDMTDAFVEELYGSGVFRSLRCNHPRCEEARNNEKAKAYWYEYLKRNEKGDEIVLTRHKKEVINIINEVREALMKEFAGKKYKVESNPTSNLMIGPFDMYKELPTLKFYDHHVNVSVNTDAKGVFSTSLYMEYSLLALVLQKEGKDWSVIKSEIEQLMISSNGQRFG